MTWFGLNITSEDPKLVGDEEYRFALEVVVDGLGVFFKLFLNTFSIVRINISIFLHLCGRIALSLHSLLSFLPTSQITSLQNLLSIRNLLTSTNRFQRNHSTTQPKPRTPIIVT
jgi:hypothetical protein